MARRVYIHVGLPKTGTSYLQEALWQSRETLLQAGVLVPGESRRAQRLAVWDLFGRRLRGVDQPKVPGSWRALRAEVRGWPGPAVLLSDEFLVHARRRHVRRMVRAFAPAEVHAVVTVRDVGRVIGSMWQQEVAKGRTWPWPEFVAAVRDPERGRATAGIGFWLRYDLPKVLEIWESVLPPERIHVVVVPAADSAPTVLLDRFAAATQLPRRLLTPPQRQPNPSLGVVQTELLRRLNTQLGRRLNERQHLQVRRILQPVLRDQAQPERVRLPEQDRDWAAEVSEKLVALLANGRYHVVGELTQLRPDADNVAARTPEEVTDSELANVATSALTAVIEQYAGLWWRMRRRQRAARADRRTRLTSAARAVSYRVKVGALETADENRFFARAAQTYLRLTSRRT